METSGDSERVDGVPHLAGSLKQQRQNAVKIDVTADVLADRIKVNLSKGTVYLLIPCSYISVQVMCTVADDSLSMKHIYLQDVQRFTRMFNSCREEEESLEVAILVFGISRHLPGGAPLVPTVESSKVAISEASLQDAFA